jgi:nudix-type nucleoside diphosphatase (YffH/AdpP family)
MDPEEELQEIMPGRAAAITQQRRLFDDFFKIDELMVAHQKNDGTTSSVQRRLVFERGDSVAVLLFNRERNTIVLVEQFKVPALVARRRDEPITTDGWLVETLAGMIDAGETPQMAAIRETLEETGYRIATPELIGRFFASPGGTSERVFLYFAEVGDTDRVSAGGGIEDEDVQVLEVGLDQTLEQLAGGLIEDPKLAIAAYWLQNRLRTQT